MTEEREEMGRSNAGPSERPQKRDRSDEPTCPVSPEGEGGTSGPNVDVLPWSITGFPLLHSRHG